MGETASAAASQNDAEAMAKFLSFLSHDLRGGLNGAVLMLEVVRRHLSKDPAMTETLGDLEMVRRSILETVALMDRFVFAERLRMGRVIVNLSGIDLKTLLLRIINDAQLAAQERGTTVELDCEAGLNVNSDEVLLKRLLGNLLDNAIKFSRRAPVTVRAVRGATPSSAAAAQVQIIDRGLGISPEKIAQLAGTLNVSEPYGHEGAGMGLYIARRAARILNAELRAQPNPGGGTVMTLELP